MTREEAIKDLKELLKWYLEEEPMSETVYKREAVNMAISALSAEGDLISRQAVFNIIEREQFKGDAISEIEKLPSVENKGEWIPVSERLPRAYQKVLVTYEEFHWKNEPTTYGVKLISFGGVVDFIAWMPLPEPYKAEKGGEE